jgi:hypothetical protein
MKFSENGLYVERYIKCGNCGVLIYQRADQELLTDDAETYCSSWCIEWKNSRKERRSKNMGSNGAGESDGVSGW